MIPSAWQVMSREVCRRMSRRAISFDLDGILLKCMNSAVNQFLCFSFTLIFVFRHFRVMQVYACMCLWIFACFQRAYFCVLSFPRLLDYALESATNLGVRVTCKLVPHVSI